MKLSGISSTVVALCLAGTVTAGSMYVTLNAAAVQETEQLSAAVTAVAEQVGDPVLENDRSVDVYLDADGRFTGRLSTVVGPDGQASSLALCQITLFSEGRKVASVMTDDAGIYTFSGLSPGVYGLMATGKDAYVVTALRLVPPSVDSAIADAASPVAIELQTNMISVFQRDFSTVRQLIDREFPPCSEAIEEAPLVSIDETTAHGTLAFGQGAEATSLVHHQVQLRPDGSLPGRIQLLDSTANEKEMIRDMTAYFVMDNTVIGSTVVNPDGSFLVMGLTPGLYSVVAVGTDGVMAFGIDILGSFAAAEQGREAAYQLASVAETLNFCGAAMSARDFGPATCGGQPDGAGGMVGEIEGAIVDGALPFGASPVGGPFGGAGGGFGGGAGGGAAGGGGGLGALLAAGIAGAIGYAIADNDNNNDASGK